MPLANELALSAAMTTPSLILMETLLKDPKILFALHLGGR
jgi:hypothetical protein